VLTAYMESPRVQELAAFSEALERLYQPVSLADFPAHLFSIIAMLIPDAMMSFDQVSKRTGAMRHERNFRLQNPEEWMRQLAINLEREHPAIAYVRGGGREQVLRLSDFISQRQLRETALYQDNYKAAGIECQVAVVLPIPGYIAGLAINRSVEFRDRELTIIRLLCPHILRAHANACLIAALQNSTAPMPAGGSNSSAAEVLTAREREVFHWLAQGKRDREIATILGSSHRTVHKHVQSILAKLGVETRSAAVARALET
jgi:DNA-binding CsgD family transcriptional regulator